LLCGGQSNMSGRGSLTPTAVSAQEGVYIYDKAEEFRLAYEPSHAILNQPIATSPNEAGLTAPGHSALLVCGKVLNDDANKTVLVVPCGVGGTSIQQWDTPSTASDRTTLFGAMVYRYGQAAAKGGQPVIVWYGHEGNTGMTDPDFENGGVGTAYQSLFTSLIEHVREHAVDAPLILVQLASDDDLAIAEGLAAVGEAQRQLEI